MRLRPNILFAFFALLALQPLHAAFLLVPSPGYGTIAKAAAAATAGDTIIVSNGLYREEVELNPGVVLKAQNRFGARISGRGRGIALRLSNANTVIGMQLEHATVGVLSQGADNQLRWCRIVHNQLAGMVCVGQLPHIEDTIIAFNRGCGIQGQDARTTNGRINHCTIVYNATHAIALSGKGSISVQNSIIAFNDRGDIHAYPQLCSATLERCNLYRNAISLTPLGSGCISVDPGFVAPRALDFALTPTSPCRRADEVDNSDYGARLSAEQ
jgi:hypothetical protein